MGFYTRLSPWIYILEVYFNFPLKSLGLLDLKAFGCLFKE